jgi:hypothetical protein
MAIVVGLLSSAKAPVFVKTREYGMEELAEAIRHDLEQLQVNDSKWVENTLSLARHLLEARNSHKADREFHEWLGVHKLYVNEHDRAALIHFGKDLELARKILEQTKRKSYKNIWRFEMMPNSRSVQVDKPEPTSSSKQAENSAEPRDSERIETIAAEPWVFETVKMIPEKFTENVYETAASIDAKQTNKRDDKTKEYYKLAISASIIATSKPEEQELKLINGILEQHGYRLIKYRAEQDE